MARLATGSRRSGTRSLASRGGWVPWRGLRGCPGTGFWPDMGRLSVWCVAVMCAMVRGGATRGPMEGGMTRNEGPGALSSLNFQFCLKR